MNKATMKEVNAALHSNASYHIKSRDGYYLSDDKTWTAKKEYRGLFSFRAAMREIDEAFKWNPSAEIHPEA